MLNKYYLYKEWWKYIFAPKIGDVSWLITILCRWRGHPAGVYWYSSGMEPDMHCKCCGDDLG